MDRHLTKLAAEDDARFIEELMKYVKGEPNDIKPNTVEHDWAEKAKWLIAYIPELALPENATQLLDAARGKFGEDSQEPESDSAELTEDDIPF